MLINNWLTSLSMPWAHVSNTCLNISLTHKCFRVKQSNQEQKQQLEEALEAKNLFLDEFAEIESELDSIQSEMKELASQNFSWDPEYIQSRTEKSEVCFFYLFKHSLTSRVMHAKLDHN